MPDITQPETVRDARRRLEGQGQGAGKDAAQGQPSKKVAATYQEAARTKPPDDRITILGIPVEQITPATQAALAGLVAEINHLRNVVKRHERALEKRSGQVQGSGQQIEGALLEPDAFVRALGGMLAQPPAPQQNWVIVLIHVSTYEDIRRSSGLIAANSALADVAHRLRDVRFNVSLGVAGASVASDATPPATAPSVAAIDARAAVPLALSGYAGGSNLAALAALPQNGLDTAAVARTVRDHLAAVGYTVGGIDMALATTVVASVVGGGESPLLALGRADHLMRTS